MQVRPKLIDPTVTAVRRAPKLGQLAGGDETSLPTAASLPRPGAIGPGPMDHNHGSVHQDLGSRPAPFEQGASATHKTPTGPRPLDDHSQQPSFSNTFVVTFHLSTFDEVAPLTVDSLQAKAEAVKKRLAQLGAKDINIVTGKPFLPRCQDMPPESFLPPERAAELLKQGRRSVDVVSYCRRSPGMPDPDGRTLEKILGHAEIGRGVDGDRGLFVDFACIPQTTGTVPSTGTSADGAASSEFDSSVALVTPRTALAGAQLSVTELERDLFAAEQEGGQLSSKLHAGRTRMSAVRALLDGREADVYEAEEVARESEGRRRARTSERLLVEQRLKYCEAQLLARWREHVHLSALPDFQPASTLTNAAQWVGVGRFGDEPDADVDASTMRQRAKGKEKRHGADAGYVEFHTVSMGVKLSMSMHPRLRNVRIDELWEEVQQQSIPRHEWHAFVRARLLDEPKDLVGIWSPATALFLNVRPLYDQLETTLETTATTVTGALGSLGDNARKALWRPASPPPP